VRVSSSLAEAPRASRPSEAAPVALLTLVVVR